MGSIGFTFSFPVKQHSLTSGTLIHWTKGFNVKNVENCDVTKLLIKAFERRTGIEVLEIALLNDTVGTLLCGGQLQNDVSIGFILGTGCNAAYLEKSKYVHNLDTNEENVIINTEFGGFGSLGEIKEFLSEYDLQVDKESLRPGEQM